MTVTMADPSIVVAAGAICWRVIDGKMRVLLVHRAAHGRTCRCRRARSIPAKRRRRPRCARSRRRPACRRPRGAAPERRLHALRRPREDRALLGRGGRRTDPRRLDLRREQGDRGPWSGRASPPRGRNSATNGTGRCSTTSPSWPRPGTLHTFAIIALRHGKAVPPASWDGPDATRPLLHRGLDQVAERCPGDRRLAARSRCSAARRSAASPPSNRSAALTGVQVKQTRRHQPGRLRGRQGHRAQDRREAPGEARDDRAVQPRTGAARRSSKRGEGRQHAGMDDALSPRRHALDRRSSPCCTCRSTTRNPAIVAFETHGPLAD